MIIWFYTKVGIWMIKDWNLSLEMREWIFLYLFLETKPVLCLLKHQQSTLYFYWQYHHHTEQGLCHRAHREKAAPSHPACITCLWGCIIKRWGCHQIIPQRGTICQKWKEVGVDKEVPAEKAPSQAEPLQYQCLLPAAWQLLLHFESFCCWALQ